MRIRRSVRLGVVLCAALGITAGYVPPASAQGTGTVDFQGEATLNAGLDSPCTTNTTTHTPGTKGVKSCPPNVTLTGDLSKKGKPVFIDGNTRVGTFNSGPCVATVVNGPSKTGNKTPGPKPAAGEGPDCIINATFTVTGYCGLSQGQGSGTFTTVNSLTGYRNNYWFNFTWVSPGGNLVVRGNVWKTGPTKPAPPLQSDLEAVVRATPRPAFPGEPSNSCLDKSARRFLLTGTATVTHPKVQP